MVCGILACMSAHSETEALNQTIQSRLLAWADTGLRDLPWRRDRTPYRVWVSEIMLQQTRVETVIPYFQRWMANFPTIWALARSRSGRDAQVLGGIGLLRALQAPASRGADRRPRAWGKPPQQPRGTARPTGHRSLHSGRHPLAGFWAGCGSPRRQRAARALAPLCHRRRPQRRPRKSVACARGCGTWPRHWFHQAEPDSLTRR